MNSTLTYNAIHETYLYNPAYSPLLRGSADRFEQDENVRYFVNVHDLVSMGGFGHRAPANVVYRSEGGVVAAHKLAQWQGSSAYQEPIYHAPPETRLHAHKAAMWGATDLSPEQILLNTTVIGIGQEDASGPDTTGQPASGSASTVPLDFGTGVEPFDYDAL